MEDDPTISDLLAYNLKRSGYEVVQEYNGRAGLEMALAIDVDLVLMDLMLPGLDGISASREIARRKPDLPIIILTARGERDVMLEGFESGADDYITKPFDLDLLLARIQARLRRARPASAAARAVSHEAPVDIGDLALDADEHVIRTGRGRAALSPKEYDLLELLLSKPGHLFPREEIVERVWHHRYSGTARYLDVHVRHLRSKLDEVQAGLSIRTVRGVGYRVGAR